MAVILVTGSFDQKIKYWDATSGVCSKSIRFGESQINKLQISKDKLLIAAGGNPFIHLYDTTSNHETPLQVLTSHTQNVTDLGFQYDGKWLYSCSEDGNIKIWDIRSNNCDTTIDTRCAINTCTLHGNEIDIIVGDQNGNIKIYDIRKNVCRDEMNPLPDVPVRSISLSPNSNLLAVGSHKGKVFLYRPSGGNSKEWSLDNQFQAHDTYLLKCLISPDYHTIATTSADHTIKIWKYSVTNPTVNSALNSNPPSESDLNSNSTYPIPSSSVTVTRCLTSHQRWVWDAVFSADSSYMVSASSDLSAKLWDLRTGDTIRNYLGHGLSVCAVALNDNNNV